MVTIDRYCQDRFISLVPVLDVEPHVNCKLLAKMWPAFQEIIASFPNIRYGMKSLMEIYEIIKEAFLIKTFIDMFMLDQD